MGNVMFYTFAAGIDAIGKRHFLSKKSFKTLFVMPLGEYVPKADPCSLNTDSIYLEIQCVETSPRVNKE